MWPVVSFSDAASWVAIELATMGDGVRPVLAASPPRPGAFGAIEEGA